MPVFGTLATVSSRGMLCMAHNLCSTLRVVFGSHPDGIGACRLWNSGSIAAGAEQTGFNSSSIGGSMMVRGLGTVIYHVADLHRAKTWYTQAFQQEPYFDEPFYIGFNIGGYELGLDSDFTLSRPGPGGGVAYWRVEQIEAAVEHFASVGAIVAAPVQDVGGGIKVAAVADPFGNLIGLIENPGFRLPDQ